MSEEEVIKKLKNIRTSGNKGELWNFEAGTILNLIEKQDKMIDLMAEKLAKKYLSHPLKCTLKEKEKEDIDCCKFKNCTECIKKYFRKKVEND